MKKLHQPHFPILPSFTLSPGTSTPFAQPQITRKTGCIFAIFNKTRDLQEVRAKSLFRPPVFSKKTGFLRDPHQWNTQFQPMYIG
jgi:hypothetical protein